MLVVTAKQFDAVDDLQMQAFVDFHQRELAGRMAADAARHGLTDPAALRAYLMHVMRLARSAGVQRAEDKRALCEIAVTLGPGFEADQARAWAGQILSRPGLTGTEKVALLLDRIMFDGV